jgi:signal recognition particle receptor subunit beta
MKRKFISHKRTQGTQGIEMGKRQAELIVDSVRSREPSPFGIALRRFDLGRSQRAKIRQAQDDRSFLDNLMVLI